jgi:CBS domain-containing protein
MNVSQLMNRNVETCRPEESLAAAVARMWERDIGCLAVVGGDGEVVGMVTDRDACMAAYTQGRALHDIPVLVAMSKGVFSCAPDDSLIEAEEIMRSRKVRRLPVIESTGKLVGIVSLNDLALESARERGRKGREISGQEVSVTLAAICEPRGKRTLTVAA